MINVNGEPLGWREGMTVQDILDAKHYTFRLLSVWINDSPVERSDFLTRLVADNDSVQIVHMISGG